MPPNQPKTPLRSVRVPDALWNAAKARAAQDGRTVTDVIVAALQDFADAGADLDRHASANAPVKTD